MQKTREISEILDVESWRRTHSDPDAKPVVLMEDLPFQTFECEMSADETSKGRAEVIL